MPNLLPQKPHNKSKLSFRVICSCLQRQPDLWGFLALFKWRDCHTEASFCSSRHCPCDDTPHSSRFAHLMTKNCINAALCCLSPSCDCGPLNLDHVEGSLSDCSSKTVIDALWEKHPYGNAADPGTILDPLMPFWSLCSCLEITLYSFQWCF